METAKWSREKEEKARYGLKGMRCNICGEVTMGSRRITLEQFGIIGQENMGFRKIEIKQEIPEESQV